MWLPRSERFLKVTPLLEVQLQDRPLFWGGDNSVVPRPGSYLGGSFGRGGRFRPQYYRPGTFPRRCFNCRRVGHFARNCPLVSKVVKK